MQKPKEFLAFSHPPDLGLWGTRVCDEIIAYLFSLPLQNQWNLIGFGRVPAGRRGLAGRAAGSRKPAPAGPPPWRPEPCSAARDSKPMPGNQ